MNEFEDLEPMEVDLHPVLAAQLPGRCGAAPDAIKDALGVEVDVADHLNVSGHAVPKAVSVALHRRNPIGDPKNDSTVKKLLAAKAFPCMTAQRLAERDPNGEVKGWMVRLAGMV